MSQCLQRHYNPTKNLSEDKQKLDEYIKKYHKIWKNKNDLKIKNN